MGFGWSNTYLIVNRGDTVEWSWSSFDVLMNSFYKVEQVESSISTKKTGFSSGNSTSSGSFLYQFNKLGFFHYWSGYINNDKFSFRGTIRVEDSLDKQFEIKVQTNGFKGFLIFTFRIILIND
jgi:plastocyanin